MRTYDWDAPLYIQASAEQQNWGRELLDKLDLEGDERVLDIGCGDGRITAEIALGVDNSENMIAFACDRYKADAYPNLRLNPSVEVNVVDPLSRKGFRFKGTAEVIGGGERFAEMVEFYRRRGVVSHIEAVVLIKVERAAALISPIYDLGLTEEEVRKRWQR